MFIAVFHLFVFLFFCFDGVTCWVSLVFIFFCNALYLCFTSGAISPASNIIVGKEKGEYDSGAPALSPAPNNIVEKEESKDYGLYPLNDIETTCARAPNIANFDYDFDIEKGECRIEYGTGAPITAHNIILKFFEKEREREVGLNNDLITSG